MSRARAAFLGIFAAQAAALAFAVLFAVQGYDSAVSSGWPALAGDLRVALLGQISPLEPLLFVAGALGGRLAARARRGVLALTVVALAAAVLAHELVVWLGRGDESLRDFLSDLPLFVLPALCGTALVLKLVGPRVLGPCTPLPRWAVWLFAAVAAVELWAGAGMAWWLWALVLMAPVALGLQWRWRRFAALLTPLAVSAFAFASGVLGFATGTARYLGYGLPKPEYFNLDPVTRAPHWNGGCCLYGPELLTTEPNNAALDLMGSLFGRMPFAYAGPYPTEEEAFAALDASSQSVHAEFSHGTVRLDDTDVRIGLLTAWWMRRTARFAEQGIFRSSDAIPVVVILGDQPEPNYRVAWVLTADQKRIIATYADYQAPRARPSKRRSPPP